MKKTIFSILFSLILAPQFAQTFYSPDSSLRAEISTGDYPGFVLYQYQQKLIENTSIGLKLQTGEILGKNPQILKKTYASYAGVVYPPYGQEKQIDDIYNSLILVLSDSLSVEFRLYNNGLAYRLKYTGQGAAVVENELATFRLHASSTVWNPQVESFANTFEPRYVETPLSQMPTNGLSLLPFLAEADSMPLLMISEAAQSNYPGMYLKAAHDTLRAVFPPYVTKENYKWAYRLRITDFAPFSGKIATQTAPYIAKLPAPANLPWRVILVAQNEMDLLSNRLIYLLGDAPKMDFSWVKPGLVAWDWYNHWELSGTSFKPGKNTATYKYFVDFAAKNGIPYINLDEGWNHNKKVFKLNKNIDVHEILRYAKSKNVGVFLWFMWDGLEENLGAKLDTFSAWGVAGLKVDFFDRDDQKMVAFAETLAQEAAKRKLMLNLHGIWKPTGMERTYPNIVNREGIIGLENNKFGNDATARHNVSLAFTRFVVGSADYTPGALFHVKQANYSKNWTHPTAMTTRAHQLAMYVVYYGALQMMPEAPTTYEKEPEMLALISKMPTVWDQSIPLDGQVGDFVVMARSKNNNWYVAGMTDKAHKINLNLSFLPTGEYEAELFSDGSKTIENPAFYEKNVFDAKNTDKPEIVMEESGGFLLVLRKK